MQFLSDEKSCMLFYVDEEYRLIFIPWSKNPDYDEEREKQRIIDWEKKREETWLKERRALPPTPPNQERPYLSAQNAIVLNYPYSADDVLNAYQQTMMDEDKYPPYKNKKKDDVQLYYGISSFKEASFGKRQLFAQWYPLEKKEVALLLPCKSKQWLGIATEVLPLDATPEKFAEAIIKMATIDVTTLEGFKVYKKYLNLVPPKSKTSP